MNVFFDLECANCSGGTAKICEFGYVITDDQLNIIKEDNLLINPRAPFNIYGFEKAGLKLSYTPAEYKKNPPLSERYEFIKELLTDENNRVFGYSTEYDAEYLRTDFNRSGLKQINFKFIDVMKLYRDYLGRKEKLSLDAVYAECENAEELVHHEAENDSLMTVECMRHFLKVSGMTFSQAVSDCPLAYGELFENRVVTDGTVFRYTKGNRMSATNTRLFTKFVEGVEPSSPREGVLGKNYCFEKTYWHEHFAQSLVAAEAVINAGGKMTNLLPRADYIVVGEGSKRVSRSRRQRVISVDSFLKFFGIDKTYYERAESNIDLLLAKIPENAVWYEKYIVAHPEKAL